MLRPGPRRPLYVVGDSDVVLPFHAVAGGAFVPELTAIRELTPEPPPVPFEMLPAETVLDAGFRWLVVDMEPVPTTSDISIAGLLKHDVRLHDLGGLLVCFGMRPLVQQTYTLLGLDQALCLRATREDALAAITDHLSGS